jgi:transcriptional regulator with XRE-family HTH domain
MSKPLVRIVEAAPRGNEIWMVIGRRLRLRRAELGLRVDEVADELGISPALYQRYETGTTHTPASLLGQIAHLFDVPVPWFFQDVGFEGPDEDLSEDDVDDGDAPLGVLTVATEDDRVRALSDCFRQLDLEGQQHLLAVAAALARARSTWARN